MTSTDSPRAQAPLIRADDDPVRVRPDDPGGLDVPHRDRLVLEEPRQTAPEEDRSEAAVLPPPEEPLARPEVADAGTLSSAELPVFAAEPSAGGAGVQPSAVTAPEALIARDDGATEADPASPTAVTVPAITVVENVAVGLITGGPRRLEALPPVRLARAEPFGGQPAGPAGRIEIAEMSVGLMPLRQREPAPASQPEAPIPPQDDAQSAGQTHTAAPLQDDAAPAEPVPDGPVQTDVVAPPPEADVGSAPADAIAALLQGPSQQPAADPPVAAPERTYRVQLAAVNSDQAARTGWEEFKGSYPDLLGQLELFIHVVEVNGRTYHRIQGGMLDSDGARTLCRELRDRGTDCIVRP